MLGRRALICGHGPQNADGAFALPLGKLGRKLTVEQGYVAELPFDITVEIEAEVERVS